MELGRDVRPPTDASRVATGGTASPEAGVAGQTAIDPRAIPAPVDPPAAVTAPTSTRTDGTTKQETSATIRHHVTAMLAT